MRTLSVISDGYRISGLLKHIALVLFRMYRPTESVFLLPTAHEYRHSTYMAASLTVSRCGGIHEPSFDDSLGW